MKFAEFLAIYGILTDMDLPI